MVHLKEEVFGTFKGQPVTRYTWTTDAGLSVSAITYGAIITQIKVPNKNGEVADVVLGFDDLQSYVDRNAPYLGTTVGRCANRIAGGKFTLDGAGYLVAKNQGGTDHLHGGVVGFDKVVWTPTVDGTAVTMSYLSKDGEEGYPGDLVTNVTYSVTDNGSLNIDYVATTTKKTVVNLTNHSYFNLGGHDGGSRELYEHYISINADRITETDAGSIPTGRFVEVLNTPYDFRAPRKLGDVINSRPLLYDDNFCVNIYGADDLTFVASARHPASGRYLEVYSDQPGVQFYTANFLPSPSEQALVGKNSAGYRRHGAFCLETQLFPDAVNHPNFKTSILKPGQVYRHKAKFVFGADEVLKPFVMPA